METNLYPLTLGQILGHIYRLLRSQFKLFIGIASLPMAAFILLYALFFTAFFLPIIAHFPAQPNPDDLFRLFLPAMLILTPLFLAIFTFYLAASIHAALQAHQGNPVTLRESYHVAWQRFGRYFWLLILCYLIAFLPVLLVELVMFAGIWHSAAHNIAPGPAIFYLLPLVMILLLAAMVWGTIIAMRLSLAFPASLAENLPAREALRRSGQLTRGAKGRIFLVLLVIYALAYAATIVGLLLLAVIMGGGALIVMAMHAELPAFVGIAGAVLAALCFLAFFFLWTALLWAAFSSAFAVLYHDQRLRQSVLASPLAAPGAPVSEQPRENAPQAGGENASPKL